jgi:hypothetical protein
MTEATIQAAMGSGGQTPLRLTDDGDTGVAPPPSSMTSSVASAMGGLSVGDHPASEEDVASEAAMDVRESGDTGDGD